MQCSEILLKVSSMNGHRVTVQLFSSQVFYLSLLSLLNHWCLSWTCAQTETRGDNLELTSTWFRQKK